MQEAKPQWLFDTIARQIAVNADPNNFVPKEYHFDPLKIAIEFNNLGLIEILLRAGADPKPILKSCVQLSRNYLYEARGSVVHCFQRNFRRKRIIKLLNYKPAEWLFDAVKKGNIRTTARLLERKFNVNAVDAAGKSPLICAALKRDRGMIKLLLSYGADVYQADRESNTAISLASTQNEHSIEQLLLSEVNESLKLKTRSLQLKAVIKNIRKMEDEFQIVYTEKMALGTEIWAIKRKTEDDYDISYVFGEKFRPFFSESVRKDERHQLAKDKFAWYEKRFNMGKNKAKNG